VVLLTSNVSDIKTPGVMDHLVGGAGDRTNGKPVDQSG